LKKYRLRPDIANYDVIECAALETGFDSPYAPNDSVLIQRIPNQGWLVIGRITVARNIKARTTQQLPESAGENAKELSFQEPDNDEALFHAQPGDLVIRKGKLKLILSKIGIFAVKLSDTCYRHMSKAKSVIMDRCFDYVLSVPRATINLFLDRQSEEPKLEAQFTPQNTANAMRFAMGGGVADEEDGFDLALGQFTRLLFQMLPIGQEITYTQNGENTKITSTLAQFLLQFGTGQFKWTADGLLINKDNSTVRVDPADIVIGTTNLTLTAETLTAKVSGSTTLTSQVLVMQQFHWLTLVQRLNSLLLVFQSHEHQVGPLTSSTPIGSPVNEKGFPIGTPIAAGEPPLSV